MKILFIAIFTVFIMSGCSEDETKDTSTKTVQIEQKSDKIVLTDISGNDIEVTKIENGFIFKGYENKVVIINFFATWCPPCLAEIPHLNTLQEKYKKDLKIISILLEENKSNEEIMKFINKNAIEFTIVNSEGNFQLAKEVGGVSSIPYMLIYDRKGKYSQKYTGAIPEEMIDADIKKVL